MTKKKLPEFKVGEFYFTEKDGDTKTLWRCATYLGEPQVCMVNLSSSSPPDKTGGVSEFANFRHLIPDPRPAHRPKGSKTRKPEPVVVEAVGKTDFKMLVLEPNTTTITEQAPTPTEAFKEQPSGMGITEPGKDYVRITEDIDKPTKVNLSTFELSVKGEGRHQHKMRLEGKEASGKDLKPTLKRLLEQVGITGSDAEIETALVLHPESEGRNRMIDIIKGKKGG